MTQFNSTYNTGMNSLTLVFSDINGTLIDFDTYAYEGSFDAVQRLKAAGIPLILCSSNNKAEIQPLREAFELQQAYIVENGSAIYNSDGTVMWQGASRKNIQSAISMIRDETGLVFETFADIPVARIRRETKRDSHSAALALQHQHSELIVTQFDIHDFQLFKTACQQHGYDAVRGKQYINVVAPGVNKGRAIQRMVRHIQDQGHPLATIGIGDNVNDISMFEVVDQAYIVQLSRGRGWAKVDVPGLIRIDAEGPAGFTLMVDMILGG